MVTFAEVGEFDTARRFLTEPKQVLLVCWEECLQEKTLHYALNLCQRIGATLDVLYLSSPQIAARQCFEALVHYVKKQTAIICTVMSSVDGLDMTNKWPITGCPLIIVKESVLGNINAYRKTKT
ncbi:MAG: hypothetical protein DRR08_00355 [Candidatus Parabeggiatoa sp. nov. 2]|nr:MAG: hypothetical protein B6247_02710 [Beggiatoa sp. 4572_84]RKZ64503.1 MAG: hypothetical protein DRR08_00355 [Gammaproteobacteria bacterium]HEC83703.1 hypothetical protein [Thioploca sp.]